MATAPVIPEKKPASKPILKPETIDAAAQRYLALQIEQDNLDKRISAAYEELMKLVKNHGVIPAKAEKSRRIQGEIYRVTATSGTSTSVDQFEAAYLRSELAKHGAPGDKFFRKLFGVEKRFVLTKNAIKAMTDKLPQGIPGSIRMLFSKALVVKHKAATIKVQEIEVA